MDAIAVLARLYFSHFPVDKGKWRVWERFRRTRHYRAFQPGAYRTRYSFSMNLTPNQQIDRFVYFWGCWEPNETWLVRNLLRTNDTFVDVGANEGYYSLLASSLVGPSGRVVSLEPLPPIAAELKANIALNELENITVIECAASDNADDIVLTMPDGVLAGMTTLRPVKGASWRVKCDRLDRLLADLPSPRLIKIDVEGAEFKTLRGLEGLLVRSGSPDVLCEVTASFLEEAGDSAHELCSWMSQLRYRGYLVKNHALRALPEGRFAGNDQESVFFTRRERPSQLLA